MVNISSKKIVEFVKDISGLSLIVALLYCFGYISWLSYYRLLGIDSEGQPLDYLKAGGDFFIATIINFIWIIASYSKSLLFFLFNDDLFYVSVSLCLAFSIYLLIRVWLKNTSLFYIPLACITFSIGLLVHKQSEILTLDRLLQIPPHRIYLKYSDIDVPICERNNSIYKNYLDDLQKENNVKYHLVSKYFNMLSQEDAAFERLIFYISVFSLLILATIIYFLIYKEIQYNLAWTIPIVFSLLLLPSTYGTFGKSYLFSYATLKFEKDKKEITTHAVYMLRQNSDNYVIYDNYNFFQIKIIPKSEIKEIKQLFKASPFDNKIPNQSTVCDSLISIPQNSKIIDF